MPIAVPAIMKTSTMHITTPTRTFALLDCFSLTNPSVLDAEEDLQEHTTDLDTKQIYSKLTYTYTS